MNDLLVLCYHAVSHTWPAALSVTPEALDRQLGQLTRRGYRGARFTDVVLGGRGGAGSWPSRSTTATARSSSRQSRSSTATGSPARSTCPPTGRATRGR